MDPLSLGLAVASAGSGIFSSITGNNEKKSQIKAANKQIKAQNQFAMQNWQYNEQMRQRQERQNNALYEMRKKEFALQKELDLDAFKEFYEDNQLQFNNLVRQVRAKSFQSSMKLAATQNKAASSALARGATGSRVGARGGAAALLQSMEQASRNEQLALQNNKLIRLILELLVRLTLESNKPLTVLVLLLRHYLWLLCLSWVRCNKVHLVWVCSQTS